jgi:hypothetical protein
MAATELQPGTPRCPTARKNATCRVSFTRYCANGEFISRQDHAPDGSPRSRDTATHSEPRWPIPSLLHEACPTCSLIRRVETGEGGKVQLCRPSRRMDGRSDRVVLLTGQKGIMCGTSDVPQSRFLGESGRTGERSICLPRASPRRPRNSPCRTATTSGCIRGRRVSNSTKILVAKARLSPSRRASGNCREAQKQ